jgi:PD-(D/E)XK nuclease superfamily
MPSTTLTVAPPTVPIALPVRYLSVSSLQRFWRCPEQWRRHYLLREREPSSPAMLLGKAVGEAIAHHFSARLAGAPLQGTEAREAFHHALELACALASLASTTPLVSPSELADLRERGEQVLATYLASPLVAELEAEQVIAVEARHELRFPGAQWSFLAYLDLVTAKGTVVDVKVKARHLGEGEARRDPQARGYALARTLEPDSDPERPPKLVFHSLRHGRNPEAKAVPTDGIVHTAGELAAFQARLVRTGRLIAECMRTGDWGYASPQGWWCSERCPAWTSCPGGRAA